MANRILPLLFVALGACAPATPPPAPTPAPPAPTPRAEPAPTPGETLPPLGISETRPIVDMHRRTIGFQEAGIWISNEFDGGRVSDAWQEGDSLVGVQIRPENAPVNNSAWYAFKVWSPDPKAVDVRLTYEDGNHRYWPKTRRADEPWMVVDSADVRIDRQSNQATMRSLIA